MVRIGINAVSLDPQRTGGAETYMRQLINQLQQCDVDEQFFVFVGHEHNLKLSHDHFHAIQCDVDPSQPKRRIIWEQTFLPKILKHHDLDLVHFPYGTLPLRYHDRAIVTIHDTHRFQNPDWVPPIERKYRAMVERNIVRRGRNVISVSQTDADRVHQWIGVPRDRLTVIHHGVLDLFTPGKGGESKSPSEPYLLWVGRAYPQKNLDVLIRAMGLLKGRDGVPRLRVIGATDLHHEHLAALVGQVDAGEMVSLEAPIPHDQLPQLYRDALIFCYPSKGESFGLPVLEAMACRTATVVADNPVFREICGDAAIYAHPDAPKAFADAILKMVEDPQMRQEIAQRGCRRAQEYTWQACAQKTLELYRRVAGVNH
jgi:glycosyltransferase involved in cell wall biosynthesis